MQINFYLSTRKTERSLVITEIRNKGQKYVLSTGINVITKYWNSDKHRCRLQREYLEAKYINEQLDEWEKLYNEALSFFSQELLIPDKITFRKKVGELIEQKKKDAGIIEQTPDKSPYFTDFVERCSKELVRKKGTKKHYTTVINLLKEFEGKKKLQFEDIDMKFYNRFQKWVYDKGQSLNYFGSLIKNIKMFFDAAFEEGLHQQRLPKNFRILSEETDAIYLTVEELVKIHRLVIDEKLILERYSDELANSGESIRRMIKSQCDARDRFLVGAFTAMRFGDYSKIDGIKSTDEFIIRRTEKTGTKVVIPMHWVVKEILERRNNELPNPISNQKFNDALKVLGRLAGIDENVDITMTKGGKRVTETFKKWELITTHTARRSGCTNMYLAGIDPIAIMGFSGHTTVKSFMKYIRIKQEQNAMRLKDNPFFKK